MPRTLRLCLCQRAVVCAARSLCGSVPEGLYALGMAPVQVLTSLARVAIALLRNQSEYDPHRRVQTQSLMSC